MGKWFDPCRDDNHAILLRLSPLAAARRLFHMKYTAPTAEDFQRLKSALSYTGEQMADLFGVAGGQQWRKYTGGMTPREMSPQMLFFGAARLALTDDEFNRVLEKMREIGAGIEFG